MDLAERVKQKLVEQETKKKHDEKLTTIEKEDLHSPPPPKPPKNQETLLSKIDWIKLSQSSDFKRLVYLALQGKSFRGSNEKLDKELNKKIEVFRDPNFSGSVKELKKMFKNGFMKPSDIIKEQEKIKDESNNTLVDV